MWKERSAEEASPSLVPCPHPTLLGSAAHSHTGSHTAAQGGGSVCPVLMLLGFGFADKTMGVFHLQSPRKKYDFTYEQAQAACAAEGASLATFQQLGAAQQVRAGGGSVPSWGWDRPCISQGLGQPRDDMWVGHLSSPQAPVAPSTSMKQEGWWVLPVTLGWDL